MNSLPSSVEAYLQEAGFSGTEILVLRKLLEDDAMSLRELGAKTGKSAGVLDQALKKLLRKGIVAKETINESPKYTLHSLQAVRDWMEEDMREKREMLMRRQRNFESFIDTLSKSKGRPDMQHFDGEEGIKQAYIRLLEKGGEMLHYLPIACKEEEDPLRDFRVQYFRERRRRKIFSRIIAHNAPLARRFQSRDVFEYRKTMLIAPEDHPFVFEEIIAGDTIACLDHKNQKACFVFFPQYAESQRLVFENLWRAAEQGRKVTEQELASPANIDPQQPVVPFPTRTLSALRDFFLSRRSIAILTLGVLLAAGITYGLYQRAIALHVEQMQERARSIASAGALQVDANDLAQLQVERDWEKPEWTKVVEQLKALRMSNADLLSVYILRRSQEDSERIVFVADSHSLNPYANIDEDPGNNIDANRDGVISGSDILRWPGQVRIDPSEDASNAFAYPTASEIRADSRGSVVSGFAPVFDAERRPIAVLAVDLRADMDQELSGDIFRPVVYFLFFFLLFVFIRLVAFNRSLFKELLQTFHVRSITTLIVVAAILSAVTTYGLYRRNLSLNFERMREEVKAIAATGALQFDSSDIEALRTEEDWQKPAWAKVVKQLINIRENNGNIMYVYILRQSKDDPTKLEFVADSHSLNPYAKIDINFDGKVDDADLLSWPGQPYDGPSGRSFDAFQGPIAEESFYEDQWGKLLSAYAPIRNSQEISVAILGIDMSAEKLQYFVHKNFQIFYFFVIFLVLFLFLEIVTLNPVPFRRLFMS